MLVVVVHPASPVDGLVKMREDSSASSVSTLSQCFPAIRAGQIWGLLLKAQFSRFLHGGIAFHEHLRGIFFSSLEFILERKGEGERKRETSICSTFWRIRQLILVCALTRGQTHNLGISSQCSNQLGSPATAQGNLNAGRYCRDNGLNHSLCTSLFTSS